VTESGGKPAANDHKALRRHLRIGRSGVPQGSGGR
jgi:hypothetical protein